MQDLGHLNVGMKALIISAAGGLGIQAVQIATLLGAHVTAIAGSSQAEFLQSYGADKVHDYNQVNVNDLSDVFDVILDLTNAQNLKDMKKLLTPNGIFIPAEPNQENGGALEDAQVGSLMVMQGDSEKLTRIASWISDGRLKAVVDKQFNFSDYLQAFSRLQEKGRRGRIILSW